jgi:hypothetical protein
MKTRTTYKEEEMPVILQDLYEDYVRTTLRNCAIIT